MPSEPPADELEALLERLCLGELDPTGWRRVAELIQGDREASRRYVEAAHYCETLRDETSGAGRDPLPPQGSEPDPSQQAAPVGPVAQQPLTGRPVESSRAGDRRSGGRDGAGPLARIVPWAVAVSAAFVAGWFVSGSSKPSRSSVAVVTPALRSFVLSEDADRSEPLGRVIGLTPVASSDGLLRSLKVGSQLGRGEVFQLTRGAARLELAGGEVLVQGPAEVSAISDNTLFVRQGTVTITHGGVMTVQTPLVIVSGESAKYAVAADGETDATVVAYQGEVAVHAAPRRGRVGDSLGQVAAGDTIRVKYVGRRQLSLETNAPTPDGILLAWDDTAHRLNDYERLVLADKPLAYWPLYRVRRHRAVLDLTQNGFDGYAIGNWPTELNDVHASQPRGAYFDGESYVESDRKPPVDLRTGFTIESWARVAGGPQYRSVFTSRWVLESQTEREQCFGFTLYAGENDRWQLWTGSGKYGQNWQQLHTEQPVARNRWTHVAAAFEPDPEQADETVSVSGVVRLFVDGVAVAEDRHEMSLEDFAWPARIGAAEFVPRSLTSWLFEGELRDVALYDHVLQPQRVQQHAEQGRTAT